MGGEVREEEDSDKEREREIEKEREKEKEKEVEIKRERERKKMEEEKEKEEELIESKEEEEKGKIKEWWKEEPTEPGTEKKEEKSILGSLVFCEITHQLEDKGKKMEINDFFFFIRMRRIDLFFLVLISKLEKIKDQEVAVVRKENIFYRFLLVTSFLLAFPF